MPPTRSESGQLAIFAGVTVGEFLYRCETKLTRFALHPMLWPTILLFLPKVNLIAFRNETAGIRIDDFILFAVMSLVVCGWIVNLDLSLDPVAAMGFALVGLFCLSNLINIGHSSILYSLRLLEYLVFYWSGKYLVRLGYDFDFMVKSLIGLNCVAILFQAFGIFGGFSAEGYVFAGESPFGLSANHHSEMGAVLNLSFAALAFRRQSVSKFWYWCILIGFCIFLTGSRSALLAHCVLTLLYVYKHSKNKIGFVMGTVSVVGLLVTALIVIPNPLSSRSADLFSAQNIEAARDIYDNIPADRHFSDVAEGGDPEGAPEGVDVSWYIRGFKWAQIVKTMLSQSWMTWIFGFGPGALGPAVDGGWLRLIAETGVVGTLAFLALLRKISRLSFACSTAVLAVGLNMLMVDSHNAYKVMALLFFLAGAEMKSHRNLSAIAS
jgi:O-antigen ligase/polysaccharide polymerase Wzy-like membrane protein